MARAHSLIAVLRVTGFAAWVLLLVFAQTGIAAPNELHRLSGGRALVRVSVELWSGDDRVSPRVLESRRLRWQNAANRAWNADPRVRFEFDFKVRNSGAAADPERHAIEVYSGSPLPDGTYAAMVLIGENPFGPHEGRIPLQVSDRTLAHETGHLLNLQDEYGAYETRDEIPASKRINGRDLVPARVTESGPGLFSVFYGPEPGVFGILADPSGVVLPYYLERVLETLGATPAR